MSESVAIRTKSLKRRVTFNFDERKSEAVAVAVEKATSFASSGGGIFERRRASCAVDSKKFEREFSVVKPTSKGSTKLGVDFGTLTFPGASPALVRVDTPEPSLSRDEGSLMESISEMDLDEAGKALVSAGTSLDLSQSFTFTMTSSSAIGIGTGIHLASKAVSSSGVPMDDEDDEDDEAGEDLGSPHGVFTIPREMFPDESTRRRSSKSIMKFTPKDEMILRKMSARMEREAIAVGIAKIPCVVLKWSKLGKPVKRVIKVSEDGSCLEVISKSLLKTHVRKIELADVHSAMFGPRTHAFDNFNWRSDYPWRCFSIIMKDRTWDFQAETDDQALMWFFALQSLSPLNKFYLTWGRLLWMKIIYRSIRAAVCARIPVNLMWLQLVLDAKNFLEMGV